MEEVIKIISLLDDEDKKKLSESANILIIQNKYNKLRKEIKLRRTEAIEGGVLSLEEIWQDIRRNV